jgi:NAD(P)-dependent dehydrogenase (short-subunit alcohol dehydrogenase family)
VSRFTGKVAIVTGAGSGIGRATARLMASEGAAVTVADIAPDAAGRVVAEIEAAGGRARAQTVDVSDADGVQQMIAATVDAFGGLDVLHNNAAALDQNRLDQDIATMDLATWDRVLDVNLTGPMLGCRFAIPAAGGLARSPASAAAGFTAATPPRPTASQGRARRARRTSRRTANRDGYRGAVGFASSTATRRPRWAGRWATVSAATASAT